MRDERVLEWTNAEQTRRVVVERLPSGMFRWHEERYLTEDETAEGGGIYEYWTIRGAVGESGMYATLLDAQNDAAAQLDWLRATLEAQG